MAAPMEKTESEKFAIAFVNENFKDDLKTLKSVKDLYSQYKDKQKTLESQVINFHHCNSSRTSRMFRIMYIHLPFNLLLYMTYRQLLLI